MLVLCFQGEMDHQVFEIVKELHLEHLFQQLLNHLFEVLLYNFIKEVFINLVIGSPQVGLFILVDFVQAKSFRFVFCFLNFIKHYFPFLFKL